MCYQGNNHHVPEETLRISAIILWRNWKNKWKDLKHKLYTEKKEINTKTTNGKCSNVTKMPIKDMNI